MNNLRIFFFLQLVSFVGLVSHKNASGLIEENFSDGYDKNILKTYEETISFYEKAAAEDQSLIKLYTEVNNSYKAENNSYKEVIRILEISERQLISAVREAKANKNGK